MSTHTPSVVVGVDGSEPAADAARAAAHEAARRRLPLRLVRAFHWPAGELSGLPLDLDASAASRRSANADLARLRTSLADVLPEWQIGAELLDGRPETALCQAVGEDDLLVVGASGLTWGPGSAMGSVAEVVAARAPCPVLVHRTPNALDWRRRGVVVGIDGGAGSVAVLDAAATEAGQRGEPLHVVHAWRQLTEDAVLALRWRLDAETSAGAETAAVAPLVAALRSRHPDLAIDLTVERGRAGKVLVQAAATATLVVVGRRDVDAGGPGATVHSALHRVEVPVLAVPVPTTVGASSRRAVAAVAAPIVV
ncbi:universal stress protein [Modestobacter muralis]|uniref:Universal stress protein n=1 Tax=Modestobacter muralis TaxID=1608614 RepID=A0A6P0EWI8_9ACTN|nr:universal stress protein [Modestobacter muralis]NEK95290.1 universal stress protein [Modestobacter muralis]NEN52178.1 universal stress protein [Modestobacter muralis]